jgi:hypothetical protein
MQSIESLQEDFYTQWNQLVSSFREDFIQIYQEELIEFLQENQTKYPLYHFIDAVYYTAELIASQQSNLQSSASILVHVYKENQLTKLEYSPQTNEQTDEAIKALYERLNELIGPYDAENIFAGEVSFEDLLDLTITES